MAPSAGQIPIDYEFRLTAVAQDRGEKPMSAEVSIILTVKDSDTRPPTFILRPNESYDLPENYRDTEAPIARVKAMWVLWVISVKQVM